MKNVLQVTPAALEAMPLGQPALTANLYCHGILEEALALLLVPLWATLRESWPAARLWLMRYPRRGYHWKIRLHLPRAAGVHAMVMLEDEVVRFFASQRPAPAGGRDPGLLLPPIDEEDAPPELHADRQLVWTKFRFDPNLAAGLLSGDISLFAACYFRCLAAATDSVLANVEQCRSTALSQQQRLRLAAALLSTAASELAEAGHQANSLLRFQRDWLLQLSPDPNHALSILNRKTLETDLQQLKTQACRVGDRCVDTHLCLWGEEILQLWRFCACAVGQGQAGELTDSALEAVSGAVSKVIHHCLNPIGLGLGNEILLCHLCHEMSKTPDTTSWAT